MFESSRLLNFKSGDCGYSSFNEYHEYNEFIANLKDFNKLDFYSVVGDKITELYVQFPIFSSPEWINKDITIIHIIRDIFEVAASYQTRKKDSNDNWQLDYLSASKDWAKSIDSAFDFLTQCPPNVKFGIINYNSLFDRGYDDLLFSVEKIYEFSGLNFSEKQQEGMKRIYQNGLARKEIRSAQKHDEIDMNLINKVLNDSYSKYEKLINIAIV